jgi:hypothetical protein
MIIFSKTDMAVSDKHFAKAILSQGNAPFSTGVSEKK